MPECPYAEGVSMTCSCGQCHLPATDALREYNDRLRYDLEQRDAEMRRLRDELDIAQDSLANRRVRELREDYDRLREKATVANQAMRDYNRNGITWGELDRIFAALEAEVAE